MDIQQAISTLSRSGWSQRRIARELGIDRETVARYRCMARQAEAPNPAIPPSGSEPAIVPLGLQATTAASQPPAESPNPAISPAVSKPGRVSHGEPFGTFIKAGLDGGLSTQRIYQDLVSEQKFTAGYDSVIPDLNSLCN